MPSWGSSSSPSPPEHFTEADYAPDTTEDHTFSGIAVGCGVVCQVHQLEPVRCVAFEGWNTGRRFYMCQVENEVTNCGFVSWYDDDEWPEPLKNALTKLWVLYDESKRVRIDERLQNAKLVEDLLAQRNKLEKEYSNLVNDVNKFMTESEKRVMEVNLAKIKEDSEEKEGVLMAVNNQLEDELTEMKKERMKMMEELAMMKQLQKTQADVMKGKQKTWDSERDAMKENWNAEREAMKEEKKKLEYMLFDLLKARDSEREAGKDCMEKVKRIKAIVDE